MQWLFFLALLRAKEEDIAYYKQWNYSLRLKIIELQKQLSLYEPVDMGAGTGYTCYGCEQKGKPSYHDSIFCAEYKGHIYCEDCLKEVMGHSHDSDNPFSHLPTEKDVNEFLRQKDEGENLTLDLLQSLKEKSPIEKNKTLLKNPRKYGAFDDINSTEPEDGFIV